MSCAIIAAIASNDVIGNRGKLPWRLRIDMQWFRALTLDCTVIMGRKTYQTLPALLRRRRHVVVTSKDLAVPSGVLLARSLTEALDRCEGGAAPFVIGGARLFEEALTVANRMFITHVHADVEGDVFFPAWDKQAWLVTWSQTFPAGLENDYPGTLTIYNRCSA